MQVQSGRKLVPTALGITLIRGYQCIDPDLCLPDIRSFIEQQITLVAKGQADHSHVVQHVIQQFRRKFSYFVQQVGKKVAYIVAFEVFELGPYLIYLLCYPFRSSTWMPSLKHNSLLWLILVAL